AGRHLIDHVVELDDRVTFPIGDDGAGFRLDGEHLRWRRIRRAAGRLAEVGARESCPRGRGREGQEQPSALSFSASTPRWLRHACSLSRSRATTSAGARATKFSLVSLAARAASCWSSRVASLERRRHSCWTSMAPPSGTNTAL